MTTNIVLVLVTEGKHESVDYAKVVVFENTTEALKFCKETNTGRAKYWRAAEIVRSGEQVELMQPED